MSRWSRRRGRRSAQTGFTLIEVLAALGIGAIALYGVSKILWMTGKSTQSLVGKNEFNELVNTLQVRFNNPVHCQEIFTHQFVTPANKTLVPSLKTLGAPGPATTPLPVTLDLGNVDPAHPGTAVYGAGTKLGAELTILNLEFTGLVASNNDAAGGAVARQYEIPLRIVASRRVGGYATETHTDTATSAVTTTLVGKSGGETAVGGDLLQRTVMLRVTLDGAGEKIVGCFGQTASFWKPVVPNGPDIVFKGASGTGGSVGIGNDPLVKDPITGKNKPFPDSSTYKLDVGGPVWAGSYAYRSDARLKEHVRDIADARRRIAGLHGVRFGWKNGEGEEDQLGFLAQEVEQVFPEAVRTSPGTGMKAVAYENLLAPMVEALKDRQRALEKRERELAELRRALSESAP